MGTFSGEDGGAKFLRFRLLLEEMDRRSQAGDAAARDVLAIAKRFHRLVEFAQYPYDKGDKT